MMKIEEILSHLAKSDLGKKSEYIDQYQVDLLKTIPRGVQRQSLNQFALQHMYGFDIWNAYELSWLNFKNKPEIAILQLNIPADSPWMVESKSLKLYLNSFQQTRFESLQKVQQTISQDLSEYLQTYVGVELITADAFAAHPFSQKIYQYTQEKSYCLDQLDIECDLELDPQKAKLQLAHQIYGDFNVAFNQESNHINTLEASDHSQKNWVTETLYSNLLKSNCLVTNQPDWASVKIEYTGYQINHESLLKYLISFRRHCEFHEHCVERIFCDIMEMLNPQYLTVFAQYTRRGGIDINPFRSNKSQEIKPFMRHARQ